MFLIIKKDFWGLDDLPHRKKTRLEDDPTAATCTNSNIEGNVKDTATPNDVFFRKASDLKPLKRLKHNLDIHTSCKLKYNSAAIKTLDNNSRKDSQSGNKCSRLKQNTQTVSTDMHETRGPGEGSSHGNHGNVSPGDPVDVKNVANVVVKYLSPYLKQGSIVSKVTGINGMAILLRFLVLF